MPEVPRVARPPTLDELFAESLADVISRNFSAREINEDVEDRMLHRGGTISLRATHAPACAPSTLAAAANVLGGAGAASAPPSAAHPVGVVLTQAMIFLAQQRTGDSFNAVLQMEWRLRDGCAGSVVADKQAEDLLLSALPTGCRGGRAPAASSSWKTGGSSLSTKARAARAAKKNTIDAGSFRDEIFYVRALVHRQQGSFVGENGRSGYENSVGSLQMLSKNHAVFRAMRAHPRFGEEWGSALAFTARVERAVRSGPRDVVFSMNSGPDADLQLHGSEHGWIDGDGRAIGPEQHRIFLGGSGAAEGNTFAERLYGAEVARENQRRDAERETNREVERRTVLGRKVLDTDAHEQDRDQEKELKLCEQIHAEEWRQLYMHIQALTYVLR